MKLYLARHGDSVVKEHGHEPLLSEQGKQGVLLLAAFIKPLHIHVDSIFHSGKVRAQQTAELLSTGLICANGIEYLTGLNPADDVTVMANEIMKWSKDILLVGHLPFMSNLVSKLVADNEYKEIMFFHPGSFVCLEQIEEVSWSIEFVLHPGLFR
ncbi:MAG: phosphohistidine phosphatase SixA [Gammaproteobacteria bacterium RIFCSPHIGHO2_12_FULL_41_20]|nr:MAG: phosphohistidine phosphatase SixA [Gammaproteobacteria bacterium RIFCSPHIGHO2_12_FULL_41_20]